MNTTHTAVELLPRVLEDLEKPEAAPHYRFSLPLGIHPDEVEALLIELKKRGYSACIEQGTDHELLVKNQSVSS